MGEEIVQIWSHGVPPPAMLAVRRSLRDGAVRNPVGLGLRLPLAAGLAAGGGREEASLGELGRQVSSDVH